MQKTEKKLSLSERSRRTSRTNLLKEDGKKENPSNISVNPLKKGKKEKEISSKAVEKRERIN